MSGFLTIDNVDLSNIFLNSSGALKNQISGTFSGSTTYTFQIFTPYLPAQVTFYTNGSTYSGVLIANFFWSTYSNTIKTVFNIGNAFSSVSCFYTNGLGEFVRITMNAGVTQQITYNYKQT